jgi:hypothetical protein
MNIILIIILITILLILAWAVFSNKTEPVIAGKPPADKEQIDEPEKILRRRSADRAIEKEFPAERADTDLHGETPYEREDSSGQIQLPFPANDIIADGSRFKLYKRALINSEIYAKRGDIETAVSLFKGVKDRILDSDIRSKIESNINYLNHFRHRRDEDFKKRLDSASSGQQQPSGELRLRIDGPVPQTINIGMPEKSFINTDEIIEKLSGQISKELGTLKNDIETLKSKPDDKFDLDDYAEFSNLQHEFNNLKERFEELTEERLNTIKELNKLREMKENELEKEKIKDHSPENNEILKEIRKEIDTLSSLKHSLDSLHNKIEDISSFQIPESKNQPSIIQAKYESPIPIHFDPKPVLELLDKINQQRREDKTVLPAAEEIIPEEEIYTETPEDEIIETESEDSAKEEPDEIFDEITPAEEPEDDISLDDFTTLEAEEFINEIHDETDEDLHEEEALFAEPEIQYEEAAEEVVTDDDLAAGLSEDEIEKISGEKEENSESEPLEPVIEIKESIPEEPVKEEPAAEEILKTEKEKEIEKHIDAEEDPNDFDLLSDMGKIKDDSTLTDEDIFEKILKEEKNKGDDSAFEIIGDAQKDEQEFALNDSILDGKQKAEQDFYKKFIKADRIKKRELPILKVSYDFKKLPDEFSLSREKNILEYSFYKYKPMLQKADEYIKHRHVRDAINYYRVVLDQNIPIEFKAMIKRNIRDLTEYLEKYLSSE